MTKTKMEEKKSESVVGDVYTQYFSGNQRDLADLSREISGGGPPETTSSKENISIVSYEKPIEERTSSLYRITYGSTPYNREKDQKSIDAGAYPPGMTKEDYITYLGETKNIVLNPEQTVSYNPGLKYTPQLFLELFAPAVRIFAQKEKLCAPIFLAQLGLESAYGKSKLCAITSNLTNIKGFGKSGWKGAVANAHDKAERSNHPYRVYVCVEAALYDHARLMGNARYRFLKEETKPSKEEATRHFGRRLAVDNKNPTYKALGVTTLGKMRAAARQSCLKHRNDPLKRWAHGLQALGYATDRTYAQKLIEETEKYNLGGYDELDEATPSVIDESDVFGQRRTEPFPPLLPTPTPRVEPLNKNMTKKKHSK